MLTLDNTEPAVRRAIKTAGIGKKGSRPLSPGLIEELLTDLKAHRVSPLCQGALFGALVMKGVTDAETKLDEAFPSKILHDPERLIDYLCQETPDVIKEYCVRLLRGETLDKPTAYCLGKFLFSASNKASPMQIGHESGDAARGLSASVLRVRYETIDEYEGLLQSMQETITSPFQKEIPAGDPIIQLAEPFDGVDQSNMITPLVASYLQNLNYRVVSLVGRNSGPKFGNNLLSVAREIHGQFLKNNLDLDVAKPRFGWYLNQEDLSRPIDHWVDRRKQIIKRPFLATLERFLNPVQAQIVVASAFHPPYGEKMMAVAERAGFAGVIIVRNGIEGTMAFALKRPVKILCSVRGKDQTYRHHEIEFQPEQYLGKTFDVEEKIFLPSLQENARLINLYDKEGKTANDLFDTRVRATCEGLRQAVEWIKSHK